MTTGNEEKETCTKSPYCWRCSRESGHEGSGAAIQMVDTKPKYIPGCDTQEKVNLAVRTWQQEHDKKHIPAGKTHRYSGAYTWETTHNLLDEIVVVRCSCGEAINVTDYDSW